MESKAALSLAEYIHDQPIRLLERVVTSLRIMCVNVSSCDVGSVSFVFTAIVLTIGTSFVLWVVPIEQPDRAKAKTNDKANFLASIVSPFTLNLKYLNTILLYYKINRFNSIIIRTINLKMLIYTISMNDLGGIMKKKYKLYVVVFISLVFSIITAKLVTHIITNIDKTKHYTKSTKIKSANASSLNFESTVRFIGHRGVAGLAPENTMPAFELSGKLGFWGTECDARTTSDGTWIIMHDASVNRTTNGKGKVEDISFNELQKLRITSGANIDSYKNLKVPTIKDYLKSCKKWGITPIIELKPANNENYYSKFISEIKLYNNSDKVMVISLSSASLNKLRNLDSNLTLGLICENITKENIDYVKMLGNAFLDCCNKQMDKASIDLCHKSKIKIGVWLVNGNPLANKYMKDGVDYLTTNNLLPQSKTKSAL